MAAEKIESSDIVTDGSHQDDGSSAAAAETAAAAVADGIAAGLPEEDWLPVLQKLAAESSSWSDWKLPGDCDFAIAPDLVDKIDFRKTVTAIDLQNELAALEAELAAAKEQVHPNGQDGDDLPVADLMALDELEKKMEKVVADMRIQRDRLKQQGNFLKELHQMSQDTGVLMLPDNMVDKASELLKAVHLSQEIRSESGKE